MRRVRQRCVTCPPSQWRAIQALARAEEMRTSAYVLSRVLDDAPAMALSAAEQRSVLERINRLVLLCEDLTRPLPGSEVTLAEAVAFLYRDAEQARASRPSRGAPPRRGARPAPGMGDLFGEGAGG